jgi:outer membrane protein
MIAFLRVTITGIILCVLLQDAAAQNLSVDDAVRMGLEQNARVMAARAQVSEAEAAHRAARSALLPSVEARASYTRLSDNIPEAEFALPGFDTTFTLLPVELNRYHSEVSVEQPLFAGGRIANTVRAARRQAEAAEIMAMQEQADVAFEIRRAYWALFEARLASDLIDASIAQMDAHLRVVDAQVREGLLLRGDLLTAHTRRAELRLDRLDAQNASDLARIELNRLIGRPLSAEIQLTAEYDAAALPSVDAMIADVAEAHPSVAALERRVEALQAMHRATTGAWLPEVAAVGRYVYARPNQYFFLQQDEFRASWEAGVAVRWSLFDGGRRSAETAQARARVTEAEARLEDLRDQLAVLLTQRHLEAMRAEEAVAVSAEAVAAAEESFRITRVNFREGVVLSSDVLDAEQAYLAAKMRQARALTDQARAHAAMLNALGRVW